MISKGLEGPSFSQGPFRSAGAALLPPGDSEHSSSKKKIIFKGYKNTNCGKKELIINRSKIVFFCLY